MPEGARPRLQESRHGADYAPRFAAFVRDALHRIWRGYSDSFTLARTQRRRRLGHEDLWPLATRAQHRTSAAREFCASRSKADRRDCISGNGLTQKTRYADM